ncbi:MAG: hypothetical protein ACXAC8_18085 [Candidatus Hodarchaeales archaeon]|jgi:hypothetical protein
MLERIKELEATQNYTQMLDELRKHESILTQAYSQVSSFITDPTITGILKALEEISISTTSLLRHCSSLLEDQIADAPLAGEQEVSTITSTPISSVRARDDTFTLTELEALSAETPEKELSEDANTINAKFWYIKGGQNESSEISASGNEIFSKILVNVLKQQGAGLAEKFSISPLGYEALLSHQFQNSIGQIVKTYGEEFTLIKLF